MRTTLKSEEKRVLYKKYISEGMDSYAAGDKVKFFQEQLRMMALRIKENIDYKLKRLKKKREITPKLLRLKDKIEEDAENEFNKKFEEMWQKI